MTSVGLGYFCGTWSLTLVGLWWDFGGTRQPQNHRLFQRLRGRWTDPTTLCKCQRPYPSNGLPGRIDPSLAFGVPTLPSTGQTKATAR